ncbi:MAG: YIP1 family protein [Deltaproteobacteria bacterium]|nr:YIP1 family protein [Deltaproteobacteria bacterium]
MDPAEFDRHDFIYSFGQVWKKIMTDPQEFFLAMPLTGGLANPLVFAALCLLIAAVGFLVVSGGIKLAVLVVFWGVVRLFIGAALLLLVARRLFEGNGDFEATFRVCAYAAAPGTLLWMPVVKYLAVLYSVYLVILGLQRAQGFDSVKAVLTVMLVVMAGAFLSLPFGGPGRMWRMWRFASPG